MSEREITPMNVQMSNYEQASRDYQIVEQAIGYLEANYRDQPSLKEIADSVNMSEYHFQRLFTRWVGISPKRFLQFLTKEHAKELLANSGSLLDASYGTGLSGPSRLHDLFVTCEAVTPGEYKSRGAHLNIFYGFHPTPFGECLLALTERGICNIMFTSMNDHKSALSWLKSNWVNADFCEDPARTASPVELIFSLIGEDEPAPLSVYLRGTNFQIKVWEALLQIPVGSVVSYEDIARYIGKPSAARAVSNAVAHNPIPVLIPCHRVIRKAGVIGGYRYGTARKKAMLAWEMSRN
jgi:AraC family transcriptional regulator of adaptative response/methylated-DNA-[protein]-cysteine methyltransferase